MMATVSCDPVDSIVTILVSDGLELATVSIVTETTSMKWGMRYRDHKYTQIRLLTCGLVSSQWRITTVAKYN